MSALGTLVAEGRPVTAHTPWPRAVVNVRTWERAAAALAAGRLDLLGLWAEPGTVHMAAFDPAVRAAGTLSLPCPDGRFPSVGAHHAPATRLERAIADLHGLTADGAVDARPWLDHGCWDRTTPLARNPGRPRETAPYAFLPVEGADLNVIPVGPVHAGIIEPGHFRFHASGETVVRLEERLGYLHRGLDGLLAGASLDRAAQLAGRVSGDSTVACQLAFARAAEAAMGAEVPARAEALRAVMAELERLANHLGDVGAICNDAAFTIMLAHCAILRETVLRAADAAFGHRLMRDAIVPCGVARDVDLDGLAAIRSALGDVARALPYLAEVYDRTPSLQDRTAGTGTVSAELAARFAAGGFVGRASGRAFDARRSLPYPPYSGLTFEVPVLTTGDVDARVRIRLAEADQSLALISALLDGLPESSLRGDRPALTESREGVALVEGFRGDILVWVRLAPGRIVERCHLRDPSWFQWPLLEAAIEGNIVADFPLCNKSFNCSYAGVDL